MDGDVPASPAQLHDDILDKLHEDAGVFFTRDVRPEEEYYIRRLSRTQYLHKDKLRDNDIEEIIPPPNFSAELSASTPQDTVAHMSIDQPQDIDMTDGDEPVGPPVSHINTAAALQDSGLESHAMADSNNVPPLSPYTSLDFVAEGSFKDVQQTPAVPAVSLAPPNTGGGTTLGESYDSFHIPLESLIHQSADNAILNTSIVVSESVSSPTTASLIQFDTPSTPDISHHTVPPSLTAINIDPPQVIQQIDFLCDTPDATPKPRVDNRRTITPNKSPLGHLLFSPVTTAVFTSQPRPTGHHLVKRKSSILGQLVDDGAETQAEGTSGSRQGDHHNIERPAKRVKVQMATQDLPPSTPGTVRNTLPASAQKTGVRTPMQKRRQPSAVDGLRELRSVSPDTDALLDSISMSVDRTINTPKPNVTTQRIAPMTPKSIIKPSPWRSTAASTSKKAVTFGSPVRPRLMTPGQVATPHLKHPVQAKTPLKRVLPPLNKSSAAYATNTINPMSVLTSSTAGAASSEFRFIFSTSASMTPVQEVQQEVPPPLNGGFKFVPGSTVSPARPTTTTSRPLSAAKAFGSSLSASMRANVGSPVRPGVASRPQELVSPVRTAAKSYLTSPLKDHNPKVLPSSMKSSLLKPPGFTTAAPKLESKLPRPAAIPRFVTSNQPTSVMMVNVPVGSYEAHTRLPSPKRRALPPSSANMPAAPIMKFRPVVPGTLSGWEGKAKKSSATTNENEPIGESSSHSVTGIPSRNTDEEAPLADVSDSSSNKASDEVPPPSKAVGHPTEAAESDSLGSTRDPDSPRRSRRLSKEKGKDEGASPSSEALTRSSSRRDPRQPSQPLLQDTTEPPSSTLSASKSRDTVVQRATKQPIHPLDWAKTEKEIRALTTKNTARNQIYFNDLQKKVIKVDAPRPPSPTSRIRTIADKEQEEEANARVERAKRRGVKRGVDDMDPNDSQESTDEKQKHARGAGDEEEYQTPKRIRLDHTIAEDDAPPIARLDLGGSSSHGEGKGRKGGSKARSGSTMSSASSSSLRPLSNQSEPSVKPNSKGQFVKWDKTLIFKCGEGSKNEPVVNPGKSCLSKASAAIKLDGRGNVPDAHKTPEDIRKDKVVVVKYVYTDDSEGDESAPPEPVESVATRRGKRKKI